MRFETRDVLSATPDAVLAALCDAGFWASVGQLPATHAPEVVGIEERGGEVRTRLRYRFRGDLPRAVTAVVDPQRLSWVEDTLWDRDAFEGHTTILPDHYPDKLHATAVSRLLADRDGCVRVGSGDVAVRVPIVGRQAERPIVSGLRDNLAALATLVDEWCG